jgi:aerotaxis receptor
MANESATDVEAVRKVGLRHHDGQERKVAVVDRELPYPEGRLIVSRTDPQGLITHANAAFIEISGYASEELIGQPHHILRHPDMPATAFAALWHTVQRGQAWHGYLKNRCKDGSHYWVYASVIANVRNGKLVGYTSVRRMPSRRKVAECEALYRPMREQENAA